MSGSSAIKWGDSHNFGKRTVYESESPIVLKFRDMTWENLVLNSEEFRTLLNSCFLDSKSPNPAKYLTRLKINPLASGRGFTEENFRKELTLVPDRQTALGVGSVVAFTSFFGIEDVHIENLQFGTNQNGSFECALLDIENFGMKVRIPSQTSILPIKHFNESDCGIREWIRLVLTSSAPQDLIFQTVLGYLETLNNLNRNIHRIWSGVTDLTNDCRGTNRVFLRATSEYFDALNHEKYDRDFIPSEMQQLRRGDVPYYFRMKDSYSVLYFETPHRTGKLSSAEAERLCVCEATFKSKERSQISDALAPLGSLQLLRSLSAFRFPFHKTDEENRLTIIVRPDRYIVTLADTFSVECIA